MKIFIWVFGLSLAAQILNLDKERALGAVWAEDIRSKSRPFDVPEVVAYVERMGARLAALMPGSDFRFEVVVADEAAEPIGLPGGFVFVPAAFLAAAEDEAEVAVMMAHAMGHVALRHGFVNAGRAKDGQVPLFVMGGWMGAHANARDRGTFIPLGALGSAKQNELDADRFGVDLAGKAGYDRAALARYIQRVQPADSGPEAPVPPKKQRLAALEGVAGNGGVVGDSEFLRVREMVRVRR
jgi:predicted Zn-dependent protease